MSHPCTSEKLCLRVSSFDADRFKQLLNSNNVTEAALFSKLLDIMLLDDIDLFIRALSVRYRTQPLTMKQLCQLSVLYTLLSDISLSIGGFD